MPRYKYTPSFTLPLSLELSDGQTYTLQVSPVRWNGYARRIREYGEAQKKREAWEAAGGVSASGAALPEPPIPADIPDSAYIATLVTAWDLEGEDGSPLALTESAIEDGLFLPDQEKIILAIQDILFPNAPKAAAAAETTPTPGPAVSTSS